MISFNYNVGIGRSTTGSITASSQGYCGVEAPIPVQNDAKSCQNQTSDIYLDETGPMPTMVKTKDMVWVERDTTTEGTLEGVTCPSGKGTWLIILGAGGIMG